MTNLPNILAMSVATYIIVTFALCVAGYLWGEYVSSRDWKKAYLNLYQTAITEIVSARAGTGMEVKELVSKLQGMHPDLKKKYPSLAVVKSDLNKT